MKKISISILFISALFISCSDSDNDEGDYSIIGAWLTESRTVESYKNGELTSVKEDVIDIYNFEIITFEIDETYSDVISELEDGSEIEERTIIKTRGEYLVNYETGYIYVFQMILMVKFIKLVLS